MSEVRGSIKIKDWNKFQHFKDRTPPWVKLYRDLLDDPDWHELDGEAAKVLVMLWLIASEDDTHSGTLPDPRRLSFRLRIKESELKRILTRLSHYLIFVDINTISERYQDDAPETETERETEEETEEETETELASQSSAKNLDSLVDQVASEPEKKQRKLTSADLIALGVDRKHAEDWMAVRRAKKAPLTETALDDVIREAGKAGIPLSEAIRISAANSWQGFKASWLAKDATGSSGRRIPQPENFAAKDYGQGGAL